MENIMLESADEPLVVKLIDFGLSKVRLSDALLSLLLLTPLPTLFAAAENAGAFVAVCDGSCCSL